MYQHEVHVQRPGERFPRERELLGYGDATAFDRRVYDFGKGS